MEKLFQFPRLPDFWNEAQWILSFHFSPQNGTTIQCLETQKWALLLPVGRIPRTARTENPELISIIFLISIDFLIPDHLYHFPNFKNFMSLFVTLGVAEAWPVGCLYTWDPALNYWQCLWKTCMTCIPQRKKQWCVCIPWDIHEYIHEYWRYSELWYTELLW